ncbi:MAG: type II/IV secretion system protein, partial [Pseudomonas fluorescens]
MDRLFLAVEPALLDCVPSRFSSEQLAQARSLAASSGERVLEALGGLCELAPMPFIQCLGATLHYPVLDTDSLFKATPVFDRVTLAQCLKREFILLRHDDAVIGVFADPFDTTRLAWIDDCLHGAPLYLVHADDLKA